MHEVIEQAAAALVREVGRGAVLGHTRLRGGGNNRVYRLDTESGPVLLKHFHHDPGDGRERDVAEFAFAAFAWAGGVRAIAEPLGADLTFHLVLYGFVDGRPLREGEPGRADVEAALAFFAALNRLRRVPGSDALPFAAEACFTAEDHLGTVAARVRRATRLVAGDATGRLAREFVHDVLVPRWETVERATSEALAALPDGDRILGRDERCLSPSDFGFHNALRREDGTLVFHDFEYAGWDDPAKTICDLVCQPRVPVPAALRDAFVAGLAAAVGADTDAAERARILLDAYRVKWSCIALNEFQPADARRRDFAGAPEEAAARRSAALATARRFADLVGAEA